MTEKDDIIEQLRALCFWLRVLQPGNTPLRALLRGISSSFEDGVISDAAVITMTFEFCYMSGLRHYGDDQ